MKKVLKSSFAATCLLLSLSVNAQNSVANEWIEVNLEAIRRDLSRPTVHARNLWYTSIAMYDCWAAYDSIARPYFLGDSIGSYHAPFSGVPEPIDLQAAREEAISYAAYRMIRHRYSSPPSQANTYFICDTTMTHLGYDPSYTSIDYTNGVPAALGNYIAEQLIAAGLQDGANEINDYSNLYYEPVNSPLNIDAPHFIGNPDMDSLNRWQPLELTLFCDQAGNPFTIAPEFTSPEWGNVIPFSMTDEEVTVRTRDGNDWNIYHDPGEPPHIGLEGDLQTEEYRWGFELVAKWSGQLDPADTTMIDISPASFGGLSIDDLPNDASEYPDFYDLEHGGDISTGHDLNPHTGLPYTPQVVRRGDYARILAEYWADGPESETPPGHWYKIYNEISQGPEFTWRWNGTDSLDHLEYDVKTYFTMGGAMHDAAVASWSIKGFYDYPRPVSAIRVMAELGQSTSDTLPNYHPAGLGLDPGHIEFVQLGDTLFDGDTTFIAGPDELNELKIYCWAGPLAEDTCISGFAPDYQTDVAGATWKLAKDWWPYQRPTFVSPPFAGYISGHSTFSRAAAEIMALTTGDPFFPGGMGEFECPQNNFLVFEEGPSEDITLQWATYSDASDQTSLSRLWGGIHPPCDDIPGRKIGYEIGLDAFALAEIYFGGGVPFIENISLSDDLITDADMGTQLALMIEYSQPMDTLDPVFDYAIDIASVLSLSSGEWTTDSTYTITYDVLDSDMDVAFLSLTVDSAYNRGGNLQEPYIIDSLLYIDQFNPSAILTMDENDPLFILFDLSFDEVMDTLTAPQITFPVEDPLGTVMNFNAVESGWSTSSSYTARYDLIASTQLHNIDVSVSSAIDSVGNGMAILQEVDYFSVDGVTPTLVQVTPSVNTVADAQAGLGSFTLSISYNEKMDDTVMPFLEFTVDDPLLNTLTIDSLSSAWSGDSTFVYVFDVSDANEVFSTLDVQISSAFDIMGLEQAEYSESSVFEVEMLNPTVVTVSPSSTMLTSADVGPQNFQIEVTFSEEMDDSNVPLLTFPLEDPTSTLSLNTASSDWISPSGYSFVYDVNEGAQALSDIDIQLSLATDTVGNLMELTDQVDVFSIDIISSLSEIEASGFTVFPNPTEGIMTISGNDNRLIEVIEIFDLKGKLLRSQSLSQGRVQLDISELPEGIYELRVTTDIGIGSQRIVKE